MKVIYEGRGRKPHQALIIDRVRFDPGEETEVSDEMYEEIREGSERLKGHRFKLVEDTTATSGDAG